MRLCIFGGQYGSEGKGSVAEWLIKGARREGKKLYAIGENSPNSGHTCSLGKTRNIPASAYFADAVILGPDSAVDLKVLEEDLTNIFTSVGRSPMVYIHEHAAVVNEADIMAERQGHCLVERVASTASGSGAARYNKYFLRNFDAIISNYSIKSHLNIKVLDRHQYLALIREIIVAEDDAVFECSQGALLDTNWGVYPYTTSRSTVPQVAIERNGLHTLGWSYVGVYRTFPIRTGGHSGPTGGEETTFKEIGVPDEIATVTKRTRRIFKFSPLDFKLSIHLTRPVFIAFTHLDYIKVDPSKLNDFMRWYADATHGGLGYRTEGLFLSDTTGVCHNHGPVII